MVSTVGLAVAATAVHLVLFVSIFDIYFTSPVDTGMTPQFSPTSPPTKRLVLLVADGLRADTIYSLDQDGKTRAPFLRHKIVEDKGKWGVSHTHVPTESRPGHVALIAGLYEDVSAVTHGWQDNPVPFDSVFNRSQHTWSWGSPDILPMFAKGATPGKVDTYMYDAEWEDFADSDASKLDTWVFERVAEFFKRAETESDLREAVNQEQVVFFLHLLGIDTNGHSHRPTSSEVIENLSLVDRETEKIVGIIDTYFGDDKTAYVFTSDHGMTDWGSHGAGLPEETMTPIICWGAGIKSASSARHSNFKFHDEYSTKWGLERYERIDIEQADIAPLMSTLIGVPTPVNSEGILPLGFIQYHKGFLANSLFANARQLLEQFRVKAERVRSHSLPFTFKPFHKLGLGDIGDYKLRIRNLIREQKYQQALDLSQSVIETVREGVRYYHTYHRAALMFVVTVGFLGWILSTIIAILDQNVPAAATHNMGRNTHQFPLKTIVVLTTTFLLLFVQSSPLFYYTYYSIAVLTWSYVWRNKGTIVNSLSNARINLAGTFKVLVAAVIALLMLELLVFSFFRREGLTVGLLILSLWPYLTPLLTTNLKLCLTWTLACFALSVFPLLPVVGRNAHYLFVISSGTTAALACLYVLKQYSQSLFTPSSIYRHFNLLSFQSVILIIASFIPFLTNSYFTQKETIPYAINIFSWCALVFSLSVPFFGPKALVGRLLHIALCLYTIFVLLSLSFEAVFVLLLSISLYIWMSIEETLVGNHPNTNKLWDSCVSLGRKERATTLFSGSIPLSSGTADHIRQVAICLFFGILSFFGIGNIASVNTFDPATVYCFLTVFSPFIMGSLILLKMVIPFVYVSCAYNCILNTLGLSVRKGLLLILIMTDVMALNFFFLVRDSGSWLEIGVSISHYVIAMVVCLGAVILMGLAQLLTGVSLKQRKDAEHLY